MEKLNWNSTAIKQPNFNRTAVNRSGFKVLVIGV